MILDVNSLLSTVAYTVSNKSITRMIRHIFALAYLVGNHILNATNRTSFDLDKTFLLRTFIETGSTDALQIHARRKYFGHT